ncbi:PH domain-containing protein [Candidatus Mycolicibacterium alkanivorans]|uniref:PH domain-containing protein n=1 Tax=Candidatus Mycolicibacterium alkanivorans TaxID=2954114 RepID=A0ABS9YZG8_9MYCO|nr:PH domain-containing protein [Candidatus Mycolicibacterium alkanivorans]MCI4676113.1 PH domain-containing protein [Candidatus Mycolicibacterium alkanivorans]
MSGPKGDWDVVLRPRLTPIFACVSAFVLATAGIVVGFLLNLRYTGAIIQPADQVAVATLGVIIAAAILLLALPRVRVGPAGIAVRNVVLERLVPWNEVVDVSFPEGSRWARVDIADHEYIPVLAIQSVDGERAIEAMDTLRSLMAKYRPDLSRG